MRWAIGLLLLLGAAGAGSLSRHRFLDNDELEHLNVAFFISHGERLYDTVFENHPPLLALLLHPLAASCREPAELVNAGRMASLLLAMLILLTTARCGYHLGGANAALLAAWLLLSHGIFLQKALEVRPDVPAALLLMLACVALGHPASSRSALLFGGILLGMSLWFTPKTIYAALGAAFAAALARSVSESLYRFAAIAAGGIVVAAIGLIEMARRGVLAGFTHDCLATSIAMAVPARWQRLLSTLSRAVESDWLAVTLGIVGLVATVRCKNAPRLALVLSASAVAGGLGLLHISAPHVQNLLNVLPQLSVLAAVFVARSFSWHRARGRLAVAAVVLAAAWPPGDWFLARDDEARSTQMRIIDRVVHETAPDDRVLDAWTGLYLTRLPALRHFYLNLDLLGVLEAETIEHELDRALDRPDVKLVIRDRHFLHLPRTIQERIEREFNPLRGCTLLLKRTTKQAGRP